MNHITSTTVSSCTQCKKLKQDLSEAQTTIKRLEARQKPLLTLGKKFTRKVAKWAVLSATWASCTKNFGAVTAAHLTCKQNCQQAVAWTNHQIITNEDATSDAPTGPADDWTTENDYSTSLKTWETGESDLPEEFCTPSTTTTTIASAVENPHVASIKNLEVKTRFHEKFTSPAVSIAWIPLDKQFSLMQSALRECQRTLFSVLDREQPAFRRQIALESYLQVKIETSVILEWDRYIFEMTNQPGGIIREAILDVCKLRNSVSHITRETLPRTDKLLAAAQRLTILLDDLEAATRIRALRDELALETEKAFEEIEGFVRWPLKYRLQECHLDFLKEELSFLEPKQRVLCPQAVLEVAGYDSHGEGF